MAAESNGNIYVVGRDSQQNTKEPYVPAFSVTLPGRTAAQLKLKSSDEATASSGNSSGSIVHQPASSSGPSEMRSLVDCAFLYVGESINTFVKGGLSALPNPFPHAYRKPFAFHLGRIELVVSTPLLSTAVV